MIDWTQSPYLNTTSASTIERVMYSTYTTVRTVDSNPGLSAARSDHISVLLKVNFTSSSIQ